MAKGVVSIVNHLHQTTNPVRKQFDLMEVINEALKLSSLEWTFKLVYGHKDGSTVLSSLDDWACLNVVVDLKAKEKLKSIVTNDINRRTSRHLHIPYKQCTVFSTDANSRQIIQS
jgi:hypothetical protein